MEPYEIEVRERDASKGHSPDGRSMSRAQWDRRYLLELLDIERSRTSRAYDTIAAYQKRHAALVAAAEDAWSALASEWGGPVPDNVRQPVINALRLALDGEKNE